MLLAWTSIAVAVVGSTLNPKCVFKVSSAGFAATLDTETEERKELLVNLVSSLSS